VQRPDSRAAGGAKGALTRPLRIRLVKAAGNRRRAAATRERSGHSSMKSAQRASADTEDRRMHREGKRGHSPFWSLEKGVSPFSFLVEAAGIEPASKVSRKEP